MIFLLQIQFSNKISLNNQINTFSNLQLRMVIIMTRKYTIGLISLTMIICSVFSCLSVPCTAAGSVIRYYSGSDGHFISVSCDSRTYRISSCGSDLRENIIASETAVPDNIICTPKMLIVSSSNRYTCNIIVYDMHKWLQSCVLLPRQDIDSSVLCADKAFNIFTLSSGSDKKILKYNRKGRLIQEIPVNETVRTLFSDPEGANIFALTGSGIFDTGNGTYISSDIPTGSLSFSGGYYYDEAGRIYSFDRETGFSPVLNSGYKMVCFSDNGFYAADNSRIVFLSVSGEVLSYFDTGMEVKELLASGSNLAFVSSGKLHILDKGTLISTENTPSVQTAVPSHPEEKSSSPAKASVTKSGRAANAADYRITSSQLVISGGIISGIAPGSTFAQIKKLICSGDNTVRAFDKNGIEKRSGVLGTGAKLIFSGGGNDKSFTLVIKGDITGEGNVNSNDYNALADHLISSESCDGLYSLAADMNSDGRLTLSDFYSVFTA